MRRHHAEGEGGMTIDVAVVGGGHNGLVLAVSLAALGLARMI